MPLPKLYGAQRPAQLALPPESDRVRSSGPEVVELAAQAGLFLDPWQEFSLECALWEQPSPEDEGEWEWSAFEVAIIVPRQNGKGSILEARELAGLFLFEESLILHSAHEFKTSSEAFLRVHSLIENTAWMSRRVESVSTAHGAEGITVKAKPTIILGSGSRMVKEGRRCRLRFVARTGGSGRGFTADLIVWDESFNLPESVVGAQLPTLSAVRNPQLWYTSSAVDKDIHPNGVTLARVRKRALAGGPALDDDTRGGLVWLEWQADEDEYLRILGEGGENAAREWATNPERWADSNPGMGFRLSERKIAREMRAMGHKTFRVERLGIGDWPAVGEETWRVQPDRWASLADPDSRPVGKIALGVSVSPDARTACIASSGRRDDERFHVKVVTHRPGGGTGWVVERVMDLVGRFDVAAVALNPATPAGALVAPLREAGLHDWKSNRPGKGGLRQIGAREHGQACGEFVSDANDTELDRLRHTGQAALSDAIREAGTKAVGDAWMWDHGTSTGDITTLDAATLALHAFRVHGAEKGPQPWAEYV